jgi:hypothetical protein
MAVPSIHAIRESLANVKGALIDEPWTTTVDRGDIPHVPISQPKEQTDNSQTIEADPLREQKSEEPVDEEPANIEESSIIFEIPPVLAEQTIREALGRHRGSDFERLNEASGTDALAWYFPFHCRVAQHGIYISSKGALQLVANCFRRKYSTIRARTYQRNFNMHSMRFFAMNHFILLRSAWPLTGNSRLAPRATSRQAKSCDLPRNISKRRKLLQMPI